MTGSTNVGQAIWLTGLSGAGKTTLATELHNRLSSMGRSVEILDGDEIRKGLSSDLGFSKRDRQEHARRVIFVTELLTRNGIDVIIPLISPYRETRDHARDRLPLFCEVWVKCSLEECIKRDPKGLYARALAGEISDMTGITDPYEEPFEPEVTVDTESMTVDECVAHVVDGLGRAGRLPVN